MNLNGDHVVSLPRNHFSSYNFLILQKKIDYVDTQCVGKYNRPVVGHSGEREFTLQFCTCEHYLFQQYFKLYHGNFCSKQNIVLPEIVQNVDFASSRHNFVDNREWFSKRENKIPAIRDPSITEKSRNAHSVESGFNRISKKCHWKHICFCCIN